MPPQGGFFICTSIVQVLYMQKDLKVSVQKDIKNQEYYAGAIKIIDLKKLTNICITSYTTENYRKVN